MEQIKTTVKYSIAQYDAEDNLIVNVVGRTLKDFYVFRDTILNEIFGNILDFDAWRIKYCIYNRDVEIPKAFRMGDLNDVTIAYSIYLLNKED